MRLTRIFVALVLSALVTGALASTASANPVRFVKQGVGIGYVYFDFPGVGVASVDIYTPRRTAVCGVRVQLRTELYRGRRPIAGRRLSRGGLGAVNGCTGAYFARGIGQQIFFDTRQTRRWTIVERFQFDFPMQGRPAGTYLICVRATGRVRTARGIKPSAHRGCRSFYSRSRIEGP